MKRNKKSREYERTTIEEKCLLKTTILYTLIHFYMAYYNMKHAEHKGIELDRKGKVR